LFKEEVGLMNQDNVVNGFRFLPPSLGAWLKKEIPDGPYQGHIPWTPLKKPLTQTTFALVTSAGISLKSQAPFDMERERREPTWGDPTHRELPRDTCEEDIEVNHLHINTSYIQQDLNVIFPLARFRELESEGMIGRLAPTSYSYYGYQPDPRELLETTMPKMISRMRAEGVEAVFLTPA
jgi:D-proline reductase (dithiol) PrdB